ncbi:FAD-dependent oxidoreductase [Pseudaquabacterium pictum]|nr:FAD-dependent oxidoreductase [Rubrivivax pictus]
MQAADVCVVGAGPAGITLALELAARGQKVLVLESGGEQQDDALQELSAADVANPQVHDDPRICMARRLGGTSNLWGARCQPFDPIDFAHRDWVPDAAWPIGFSDALSPWYGRACELLSCGEPAFQDAGLSGRKPDPIVDVTRLERFSTAPKMQLAHGRVLAHSPLIDLRLHCTVVDIQLDEHGHAASLQVCTPDGQRHAVPVRRLVLAMGGLESTRLLLNLQRRHPALFGGDAGPLGRHYMAHVIGEVSDITFADAAIDAAFDFFLDGRGSYARRRFIPSDAAQRSHQLPNVSFWPVVPPVADPRHRSALLSTVFLAMAMGPIGRLLMAEAIRRYHAPPGTPWSPHVGNLLRGLPAAVSGSVGFLMRRYVSRPRVPGFFIRNDSRRYGLSYHAEHFPHADSRVRLSDQTDRLGLPKLQIDLRFGEEDAAALFRAHELMRAWLLNNKLGELHYRQPAEETPVAILAAARHGTHQIGTARMASETGAGVVNEDLQTFDVPNLYVNSSAVFPSSGQANPTLTIVALSVRLASHLAQ